MPKQRLWLMLASILLIVGIIGSVLTYRASNASERIMEKKAFDVNNITEFYVESDNASVEIIPTDEEVMTVEFTANESHTKYKFEAKQDGNKLSVIAKEKFLKFFNVSFDFDFSSPKLVIQLPEKQYENLQVDVDNGKIIAENLTIENVDLESENGRIRVSSLDATSTKVQSENGRIELQDVTGAITGDVTNGSTTLITDNLDRPIDLESVNGRIEVQTENEPTNATIDISVVNGKGEIFGRDSEHEIFGDGENKVNLKTVNGSVTVTK
ncbi:DUF4097 family beta strand repeat-containing protein [Ornithinibacillus xuwenensis]|uniref:DUF4097 family beta strand repeat-containing protein n=1 Tax=Ornithinibacillus xuwenensis TaxID=3144668 RepID=A0ABU9XKW7_9BACI